MRIIYQTTEGVAVIVPSADVNDCIKDVDCLSEEADRIEARLEKLIQRKSI